MAPADYEPDEAANPGTETRRMARRLRALMTTPAPTPRQDDSDDGRPISRVRFVRLEERHNGLVEAVEDLQDWREGKDRADTGTAVILARVQWQLWLLLGITGAIGTAMGAWLIPALLRAAAQAGGG